jgi:hypothetical protein
MSADGQTYESYAIDNSREVPVAVLKMRQGDVATEARMLLKICRHPSIVRFMGQCVEVNEQLLLMEFAEHGSLSDIPYFEIDEIRIVTHVCNGGRFLRYHITGKCPGALWALTVSCWGTLPKDRPSQATRSTWSRRRLRTRRDTPLVCSASSSRASSSGTTAPSPTMIESTLLDSAGGVKAADAGGQSRVNDNASSRLLDARDKTEQLTSY